MIYTLVNCAWSDWNEWSKCSKTCGGGKSRSRRKMLQEKQFGGKDCEGNDTRVQTCNSSPCPGITNFCLCFGYICIKI